MMTIIRHNLNINVHYHIIISFDFIIHIIQWKKITSILSIEQANWVYSIVGQIKIYKKSALCDLRAKVLCHVVKMDSYLLMA